MRLTIAISWPAWAWVVSVWTEIAKIIGNNWYNVLVDKEYSSIIKWGNNIIILQISDGAKYVSNTIDFFFSFDNYGYDKNVEVYTVKNLIEIDKNACNIQNVYSMGLIGKFLNISLETLKEAIETTYKKDAEANLTDLTKWYNDCKLDPIFDYSTKIWEPRELVFGNQMIAVGWIKSGMDWYSAYPMTPASTIINAVNSAIAGNEKLLNYEKANTIFYQAEDEIAVSMSMLGAKFAWRRAMCGTSWGGFALMVESMSFAWQAELGWVFALIQRAGPSTGTPTFTEQADLDFALNSVFGDVRPVVICPSTMEEVYNFSGKTLNWSDMYQLPIILISDKQMSEWHISINPNELVAEPINRGKIMTTGKDNYKRYELTNDWVSPYTVPWIENWEFITTSYEHNEYGASVEDINVKIAMTDKRAKKMETFTKEVFNDNFYWYEIINEKASRFFVTWWFNRYVLEGFLEKNPEYGLIVITMLQPLDTRLNKWLQDNRARIEKLTFVEMNQSWQLEKLIRNEFNLKDDSWNSKISHHRKYSLYPIFEEEIK